MTADVVNLRQMPVRLRREMDFFRRRDKAHRCVWAWTSRSPPAAALNKQQSELVGLGLIEVKGERIPASQMAFFTVKEERDVPYLIHTEKGRKARWGSKPPRSGTANGSAGPAAEGDSDPLSPPVLFTLFTGDGDEKREVTR